MRDDLVERLERALRNRQFPAMRNLLSESVSAIKENALDAARYRFIRDKRSDVCGTDDREEFNRHVDEEMKTCETT